MLVNGIVIGEIPITGDEKKDLEAVTAFLKSKGHNPPTDLQQMYMQGAAFGNIAAEILAKHFSRLPYNTLATAPFVVTVSRLVPRGLCLAETKSPRRSGAARP